MHRGLEHYRQLDRCPLERFRRSIQLGNAKWDAIRLFGAGPRDLVRYVALETPDGGYYVGFDVPSAMHPQTLLCYEMGGKPLSMENGAPLRLVTTVKYGIKSVKRIDKIIFTDERPRDFWAERGYEWYAGL
jgi:DMSO/TMAO reductase YedYZ molybdopterin-dependent catalytic subunit